jgi:hypothetical protein
MFLLYRQRSCSTSLFKNINLSFIHIDRVQLSHHWSVSPAKSRRGLKRRIMVVFAVTIVCPIILSCKRSWVDWLVTPSKVFMRTVLVWNTSQIESFILTSPISCSVRFHIPHGFWSNSNWLFRSDIDRLNHHPWVYIYLLMPHILFLIIGPSTSFYITSTFSFNFNGRCYTTKWAMISVCRRLLEIESAYFGWLSFSQFHLRLYSVDLSGHDFRIKSSIL